LLSSDASGHAVKATSSHIDTLDADTITVDSLEASSASISAAYLTIGNSILLNRGGISFDTGARWDTTGTFRLDSDTYLTQNGLLYLSQEAVPPYLSNSWDATSGVLNLYSPGRTGTLNLGYGTNGFTLGGYYTTEGTIGFGTDDYITLDVTDSAVEFNETNTSLRADSPELHFGAEQGGTGKGEAYIKWDTTTNTFNIGDYTYPTPGAVNAVTIDTDDNSVTIAGDLTVTGTLYGVEPVSIINAAQVTAGTFGAGDYVFPGNVTLPNASTFIGEIIKAVDTTGVIVQDKDGNAIATFSDTNTLVVSCPSNSGVNVSAGNFQAINANSAYNYGVLCQAADGAGNTIGVYATASGAACGGYVAAMRGVNGSTTNTTKYGALLVSNGANGTNYAAHLTASGGTTNWDVYTDGTKSRIAGMLQLTDTGQQITVDTSANQFLFGNSTTANMLSIDTDTGAVIATGGLTIGGSLNPGTDFSVTGQLLWYDGTNIVGIASVGASGEVLKSQGAGQPPIFAAVSGAHDAVTVGGSYDYITLSGQVLTRGQVDLTTDVTGVLPDANVATTLARDSEVPSLITGGGSSIVTSNLDPSLALVSSSTGKVDESAVSTTELNYVDGVTSAIQTQLDGKSTKTFTANRAMQSNSSTGLLEVSSTVDTTELGYLNGVTSAIQTQINGKQAAITGSASSIDTETLTGSRALQTDSSGLVTTSAVTSTELGYSHGVTSAIQTQINGKQATITGSATTIDTETLTASRALVTNSDGDIAVSLATSTNLGYLADVSGMVQAQINAKQATLTGSANQTIRFSGTNAVAASSVLTNDGTNLVTTGNLTMASAKVLTNEIIKAVDTTGVIVQDKDGNVIATFGDDNTTAFSGDISVPQYGYAYADNIGVHTSFGVTRFDTDDVLLSANTSSGTTYFRIGDTDDSAADYYCTFSATSGTGGYFLGQTEAQGLAWTPATNRVYLNGNGSVYVNLDSGNLSTSQVFAVKHNDYDTDGGTLLEVTEAGATTINGSASITGDLSVGGVIKMSSDTSISVSAGAITVTKSFHTITALMSPCSVTTINGGADGNVLILRPHTFGRTFTFHDGDGNIQCGSDFVMDNVNDYACFMYMDDAWYLQYKSLDN